MGVGSSTIDESSSSSSGSAACDPLLWVRTAMRNMIARQHRCLGNWLMLMGSRSMPRSLPCLRELLYLGPAATLSGLAEMVHPVATRPHGPMSAVVRYHRRRPHSRAPTPISALAKRRNRLLVDIQNFLLFRTTTAWHTCSTHKSPPSPSSLPLVPHTPSSATRLAFFFAVNPGMHPRECYSLALRSGPLSLV
jgi:hypothetical protein